MWNSGVDYQQQNGWYRPKPAGGGGGGIALTFQAAPPMVHANFANPTTFSNVSVGPASADRQLLIIAQQDNNSATDLQVTVNGNAATRDAVDTAGFTMGLFRYNLTSGTTANIIVTTASGSPAWCSIIVFALTGQSSAAPSAVNDVPYGFNASPHAISAAVPVGGVGLAAGWFLTDTHGTWSNATSDAYLDTNGSGESVTAAHTSGSGTISPTLTGANFNGGAMVMGTWV